MQIEKRNGELENFNKEKIVNAIIRAMEETDVGTDIDLAWEISEDIESEFEENDIIPNVETVQDRIEESLAKHDRFDVCRQYILYRNERSKRREKGWEMTDLQKDIWEGKYRYSEESFEEFLDRVSNGNHNIKKLIRDKKFIPAGRILANRGLNKDGVKVTYSNCCVMPPVEDSIESIFDSAKLLARTYSYGGGCGLDISKLRPRNAKVNNSAKYTTGSISFMDLYSLTTELICQKGRRGALMLSIDCNHPDLEEFIDVKNNLDKITKANISVKLTDDFMKAVINKEEYELSFKVEATGEVIKKIVKADEILYKLAKNNWNMGEPGVIHWSKINNWSLLSNDNEFEFAGLNPCAEEPLPAGGSCLLGSINLSEFVKHPMTNNASFNYQDFSNTVKEGVIYLNEVLDEGLELHPLDIQKESVKNWRQIGLGIMGLAELCIKLNIKYGSKESLDLFDSIGHIMINSALQQSALLAKEFGVYPKYKKQAIISSEFYKLNATEDTKELVNKYGLYNSQILTIAPTGTISTMLGVSGGIEPIFNLSYLRKTETLNNGDVHYKVYTPIVKEYMDKHNIPKESDLPDIFVTAMNLDYKDRINVQSVWQKYIDASISSTVNVPNDFTIEEIYNLYLYSWEKGLKGITVFRDGCLRTGILTNIDNKEIEEKEEKCPDCGGVIEHKNGCAECRDCSFSYCSL